MPAGGEESPEPQAHRFSNFLNRHLDEAGDAIGKNNLADANTAIRQIEKVKGLFEIYRSANVWPFNPKALTFIVAATGIQFALTAKQIVSLVIK